jgi:hypothetical protein
VTVLHRLRSAGMIGPWPPSPPTCAGPPPPRCSRSRPRSGSRWRCGSGTRMRLSTPCSMRSTLPRRARSWPGSDVAGGDPLAARRDLTPRIAGSSGVPG